MVCGNPLGVCLTGISQTILRQLFTFDLVLCHIVNTFSVSFYFCALIFFFVVVFLMYNTALVTQLS